jgi:cobalt/nickel transport system permease protein
MLPDWMKQADVYLPPEDGGTFALRTIKTLGHVMARISIQKGHEKGWHLPALFKLLAVLALIVAVSVSQNPLFIMGIAAILLVYLCTWPVGDIWHILKAGLTVGVFALLLFLPAMIVKPSGISNGILVAVKVFLSVAFVSIYNHTTQWNHITGALRALHIPHLFIFTLDITLKYIVLLGNLIADLLTSLQLRSVGKNNQKYHAVGGVMGVTFIRGAEMNRQMYEAMRCRGFTDDYEGL